MRPTRRTVELSEVTSTFRRSDQDVTHEFGRHDSNLRRQRRTHDGSSLVDPHSWVGRYNGEELLDNNYEEAYSEEEDAFLEEDNEVVDMPEVERFMEKEEKQEQEQKDDDDDDDDDDCLLYTSPSPRD